MAITTPATDNPIPPKTASHSRRTGATTSATVNTASHSGLVKISTRSPALNTGPFPAWSCSTTRK